MQTYTFFYERQIVYERISVAKIHLFELKLSNNGGKKAAAKQIADRNYTEPFRADKRKVIAIAVELDSEGKGLVDWMAVE